MTNQIYLTLFGEQDLSDIFEIQKDLRSAEMRQAMGVPSTLSDVEEWLENKRTIQSSRNFTLGVRLINTHQIVGYVTLKSLETDMFSAEVGIVMNFTKGKGYGGEALNRLERLACFSFGYSTIIANVLTINTKALSFFDKNSYTRVSEMADHIIFKKVLTQF